MRTSVRGAGERLSRYSNGCGELYARGVSTENWISLGSFDLHAELGEAGHIHGDLLGGSCSLPLPRRGLLGCFGGPFWTCGGVERRCAGLFMVAPFGGAGVRIDVTWHRLEDLSDEPRAWRGSKPPKF
ncbi:MAG: hypothetical protein ACRD6B_01860 [Bryobacteraceae bacterium]